MLGAKLVLETITAWLHSPFSMSGYNQGGHYDDGYGQHGGHGDSYYQDEHHGQAYYDPNDYGDGYYDRGYVESSIFCHGERVTVTDI